MELTPDKKYQTGHPLRVFGVALVLCGFLFPGAVFWLTSQENKREALGEVRSQVALAEARLEGSLRRAEAALALLVDAIPFENLQGEKAKAYRPDLEKRLQQLGLAFPEVLGFTLMDAQGKPLYATPGGVPGDLTSQPCFKHLATGEVGLVFCGVQDSGIPGRHGMFAVRALVDPEGRLLGVAGALLDLDDLDRYLQSIRSDSAGVLVIRERFADRTILAQPVDAAAIMQKVSQVLPRSPDSVSRYGEGELDARLFGGVSPMIYAYRVSSAYPFMVISVLADIEYRNPRRQRIYWVLGLWVLDLLGLAGVLTFLFRQRGLERRALQAQVEQETGLRDAQRLAQLGFCELDLLDRRLRGSEAFYRVFEFGQVEIPPSFDDLLARVHPEDREFFEQACQPPADSPSCQGECRLVMPDGRIKHVRVCGERYCDYQGTPVRSVVAIQDVTDQRRLESQSQLLGSAFQYSGEAIIITDSENNIVTVNPAFTRLTGYSVDEAKGRNPRFLSAGKTSAEEFRKMWEAIGSQDFWQGEIWDRRKDGGIYPKWMSISVIRDAEGGVRYYIAHFTDVSVERAVEAQLQHVAHHDALTGLLNRLSLQGRLEQALAAARREAGRVALLFIDLDRFKVINDTVGHHIGDKLLIEVAQRLRENVRDSDVVARLGGDEFVIMLTGIEHSGAVALVAAKIVASIGDPYRIDGYDLYTTPSVGIAIFPSDGDDGETLMKNADAAMYHAKAAGRNNFQFFDSRMNDAAIERLRMEHSLRQALAHDEFCLYFQPIIELATGRVQGVEALIRWRHPEQGLVLPGRFIGLAEECGLIQPLGEWVFWSACRQLADFRDAGLRDIQMGINISSMQMRNGNLPVLAKGAIEAFALEPASLIFEITESVAMQQPEETVRILDILHDMGVSLAIDDFGTGYSSLSYLRMFPIDHLKLDRSFVREIGEDADSAAICDATIGLAHNLGMKLVAEGVETGAQLDYLRRQGCDLVQGFFFSQPVPADEIIAFIRQRNA